MSSRFIWSRWQRFFTISDLELLQKETELSLGSGSVKHLASTGRLSVPSEQVELVRGLQSDDRQWTVRELSTDVGLMTQRGTSWKGNLRNTRFSYNLTEVQKWHLFEIAGLHLLQLLMRPGHGITSQNLSTHRINFITKARLHKNRSDMINDEEGFDWLSVSFSLQKEQSVFYRKSIFHEIWSTEFC